MKITEKPQSACDMCGLCCKLFLIPLSEEEYRSGEYQMIFDDVEIFKDFTMASECGAHLLKQQEDGSCVYLKDKKCSIHERRPVVCRGFFCKGSDSSYDEMKMIVVDVRANLI